MSLTTIKKALALIKSLRRALDEAKDSEATLRRQLSERDAVIEELRRQLADCRPPKLDLGVTANSLPASGLHLSVHDEMPMYVPRDVI